MFIRLFVLATAVSVNAAQAQGLAESPRRYEAQQRLVPINYIASKPQMSSVPAPLDKKQVQEQIRDLADTLKRLHHTSGELHAEVNRREMIVTGPDYLDQDIMDPWMSAYPGLNPTGLAAGFQNTRPGPLLPPRKKYIDLSMAQLQQLVPVLDADITSILDATQQGNPNSDAVKAQMLVASDARNRVDAANQKLISLTKAPPYDNKAISAATEDIRDDVASINEVRHRVAKLIDRD